MSPARWDKLLSLHSLSWEALGRTAVSQGLLRVGRVGQSAHVLQCQVSRRLSHSTGPQGRQTNVSWGLWGEMRRCRQGASPRQGRRAVISARTRTLHAARCELVRSVLLIASPTAAAREDAASRVRLHETSGAGVWGTGVGYLVQLLRWHKRPFLGLHLRSLTRSVAPVKVQCPAHRLECSHL